MLSEAGELLLRALSFFRGGMCVDCSARLMTCTREISPKATRELILKEHLTTATTMYRDMGMTYWLEKAEAEMAELR
jgi:hypothetical protein